MDHDEKLKMCETMRRFGGGFVIALAECFTIAAEKNLERLCKAFPHVLEVYGKDGVFQRRSQEGD